MNNSSESNLKRLYEEQNLLIEEIKDIRNQDPILSKETTRLRTKRDEIKHQRQALLEKARKAKELRDELNRQVSEFKGKRNEVIDESQHLRQKITLTRSGISKNQEYDELSVAELKYKAYELEYALQTARHSPKEENEIVNQIATLEDLIEKRIADGKLEGKNIPKSSDISQTIDELKEKAQSSHEKMIILVERAEKEHVIVSKLFDEVSKLQEEENNLHQAFVDSLNSLEGNRTKIEEHQKRLDQIKDQIKDLRFAKIEQERKDRQDTGQKQVENLLEKKRKGEELTPEEMEFLMAHGESPF